ncbi:hypothetical protein LOK46_11445 [Methylobacterium sp. NMS14P]|uniref:hypothetical protein n=1 Tax=Methylobacterium sp. NMS14P TaxID=2894310 RepID=UPI00235825DF|nr:hypothetical protein [Methylobacterium sp. NMS14P]WCS27401.1 hypothetical protein LOK46_11445 [Methylobacterium sp. NMS14P]
MESETATLADPKAATAEPFTLSTEPPRRRGGRHRNALSGEEPARRHRHRAGASPHEGEDRGHQGLSEADMSDVPDQKRKTIADSVLVRLSTFALGAGLYEGIARSIVEKVVADMPEASVEQIAAAARMMMLFVSS